MYTHNDESSLPGTISLVALCFLVLFYSLLAVRGPMLLVDLQKVYNSSELIRTVRPINAPSTQFSKIEPEDRSAL